MGTTVFSSMIPKYLFQQRGIQSIHRLTHSERDTNRQTRRTGGRHLERYESSGARKRHTHRNTSIQTQTDIERESQIKRDSHKHTSPDRQTDKF